MRRTKRFVRCFEFRCVFLNSRFGFLSLVLPLELLVVSLVFGGIALLAF